jgi:hypothetical protein
VQFEFPWELGPPDGRYLVRDAPGDEPAHVLVLATLGAPQRRWLGARRAREAAPEPPPEPVATARATVIDAAPVSLAGAEAWLAAANAQDAAAPALAVVARAVRDFRLASADPAVREPVLAQALVVRAGHGSGEQVAQGRWTAARELPPERPKRERRAIALQPHERLAALLGARSRALACEELTLRAREDLDAGRLPEAALQLRAALDAALVELAEPAGAASPPDDTPTLRAAAHAAAEDSPLPAAGAPPPALAERVEELRARRTALDPFVDAALAGTLAPPDPETLAHVLGRLEAALRARAAAGG